MQMIWLLEASVPAKKVHFNLNGSELRGFHIKARSGRSSILYTNPLAPKAVACFCRCPSVFTGGQCAHSSTVCQSAWFWFHFLAHIYSCHMYSGFAHIPTNASSHVIISLNVDFLSYKTSIICIPVSSTIQWVNHDSICTQWQTYLPLLFFIYNAV